MHQQIRTSWILILIIIFAFWLRIYKLSTNPNELFSDEITQVLSARSIIETGKDINGNINLFLYNKIKLGTPIYGYLAAISTYAFGNNSFAVRLPATLAGTISIFLVYLISFKLTNNKLASLTATFVGSIVPWGIYFSRIGWEPALTVTFLLSSIFFLLRAIQKNSQQLLRLSFALFGLSLYASDTLTLFAPLFLITILAINFKYVIKNLGNFIIPSVILVIIIIPFIYVSLTNPLKNDRAIKLSTFRTGVNHDNFNIFTKNYLAHFNYNFLFKTGDPNLRHGTGVDGVLYPAMLPFLIIGIFFILKSYKNKNNLLLLFWLVYFPLGGSLTNDGIPHATRTSIGWPLFTILTAIGIKGTLDILINKKLIKLTMAIFFLVLMINFTKFFRNYFIKYPITSQSWWEYGQKQVYEEVKKITKGDESLCLGNIDYWHEETLNHYYFGFKYNYRILYDTNDPNCLKSKILVLSSNETNPSNYRLEKIVYDLENNPKWNIYKSLNSYKE